MKIDNTENIQNLLPIGTKVVATDHHGNKTETRTRGKPWEAVNGLWVVMLRGHALPHQLTDLDKLLRCIFDALSGIVWADDAQVIQCLAVKLYAQQAKTGVMVRVENSQNRHDDQRHGKKGGGDIPILMS